MLDRVRVPPRSPTSLLLCSPPTPCPHQPWLRFPLPVAYLDAGACSVPGGRRHVRLRTRRASETGHRLSAKPDCVEERRGPPRLRGRPLRACHGRTPRRIHPLLAHFTQGSLLPSGNSAPWASGKTIGFGAACPWPTCSRASASPALFRRLSQGSLPTWAGSPLVGRDLHPLDDIQSFMKVSPPPIPFDQQSLVALNFLSANLQIKETI